MSGENSNAIDNVVPLIPLPERIERNRASAAAGDVRRQLRLLQGYADLMEGLSPEQSVAILKIMGQKIQELTLALRPFIEEGAKLRPNVDDYRAVRLRHRELITEYRLLIKRLHSSVRDAELNLPDRSELSDS